MEYVKDNFGNIIGYTGDDLSQQEAKMAGYPQGQVPPNIFKSPQTGVPSLTPEQKAGMTYTQKELDAGHHLPNGGAPAAKMEVTKDRQGNYYTNGVKTPMTVFNPDAVPYRDQQSRPQITNMDELAAAMGYTSPEEEARLRKASVNNQRILAVADALRHIGNIANTVNYAPAQKFNQPWAEEQARYEHGKALRDAANQRYYSYQRQRADQERAERKLDAQIKKQEADAARNDRIADARISRYNAQNSKDAASQAYWETRARLQEEGWPLDKAIKEAKKAEIEARTELTKTKTANGGYAPRKSSGGGRVRRVSGGNGYEFYDKNGVRHTAKTVTELEAKLQEYAPEIASSEEYVKGVDAFNKPVKGNRKVSAGTRAGNANRQYRPVNGGKGGKIKINY